MTRHRRTKLRVLEPEELEWLKAHHLRLSAQRMARHLHVSDYILVKLLIQHGLRDPTKLAPKYSPSLPTHTWRRPCLRCRSTAVRPRNLYLCDRCRTLET